jgi:hypothetical protein
VRNPGYLREFLEHCLRGTNHATGEKGTPLDFIAFHAKGAPTFVDGHVRMGIANQLRVIDSSFGIIASFPELKGKPIVIGESDPDGCAACSAKVYPQNDYRNGALYASYTAASFARKHDLAQKHGVNLEGALTWAFEFEGQPFFAGFRVLATNGLALPVLNVFRMFGQMSGKRLPVDSDGPGRPLVRVRLGLDRQGLWHEADLNVGLDVPLQVGVEDPVDDGPVVDRLALAVLGVGTGGAPLEGRRAVAGGEQVVGAEERLRQPATEPAELAEELFAVLHIGVVRLVGTEEPPDRPQVAGRLVRLHLDGDGPFLAGPVRLRRDAQAQDPRHHSVAFRNSRRCIAGPPVSAFQKVSSVRSPA